MAASDLVVGKPGGLTTSEALARGLVFVVVSPIPGQEERNSDHLLEEGAAIRCNNLPGRSPTRSTGCSTTRRRLAAMRANARRLGRPARPSTSSPSCSASARTPPARGRLACEREGNRFPPSLPSTSSHERPETTPGSPDVSVR